MMIRKVWVLIALASVATPLMAQPNGGVNGLYFLHSGNSSAIVAPQANTVGAWSVDGVNQLWKESFFYRTQYDTREKGFWTLPGDSRQTSPDKVKLFYQKTIYPNMDTSGSRQGGIPLFQIEVCYDLDGYEMGSGQSKLTETVQIKNCTNRTLGFNLFEYTDFDLGDTPNDDSVCITQNGCTVATQTDGSSITIAETSTCTQPDYVEAGVVHDANNGVLTINSNSEDSILQRLMDGNVDNLNNDPLCVEDDDVAFAFQWDLLIPAYESMTICKVKEISAIPEPLTLFGAMMGIAGIGGYIRKRRAA